MTSSSSTYSFWLLPAQGTPARDRAQRLIDALASRHGSPKFVPHVTLAGGFKSAIANASAPSSSSSKANRSQQPSSYSDAALAARALAESHPAFSRPLTVTLRSVSSGSTYHRCVYALAEASRELAAAAAAAGEAALGVEAAAASSSSSPPAPSSSTASSFKPDETFMPHLSLLYSSDPRAREEGLAEASAAFAEAFREKEEKEEDEEDEEGRAGDDGAGGFGMTKEATSWLSSEIEVWLTEGEVESWRCEARVPFGGKKT